jgi:UDP-GlcNAc:undecaprenyl-phosphate/decaprenyl-phosphate GlcNAc-1-phosphate transferase
MAALTPILLNFDYAAVLSPYMPVFYVAFLVTIILTPIMRALAHQHGVVDDPDNKRKVHTQPIAYLGGVSIFLGWLAGITIAVFLRPHNDIATGVTSVQIPPGILMGAFAVVFFGLMDDIYSLSPKMKLFGQFLAAGLMILPGLLPVQGLMGTDFFLGTGAGPAGTTSAVATAAADATSGQGVGPAWMIVNALSYFHMLPAKEALPGFALILISLLSALLAVAVIVSTCNAANLLDGLDGLCSGVTSVTTIGYLILAVHLAHGSAFTGGVVDPVRICLALALLGALLGFLPFNFNPASIFMGDTGSMFLGFMCGTMMLLFGYNGPIKFFLAAIVMFGLPMMDTFLAIVRRKLAGKKIFSPDSNHFHHFLIRRGFTVRRAVILSYAIATVFVSFGLVMVMIPTRLGFGIYLILFGWIIVAAFKMGLIFQNVPEVSANTTLNLAVLTPVTVNVAKKTAPEKETETETETEKDAEPKEEEVAAK